MKKIRNILSVILMCILFNIYTVNAKTVDELKAAYPDGYIFNETFDGGSQCMGFALKMFYEYYGVSARSQATNTDINSIQPGDLLYYYNSSCNSYVDGHKVWVIAVNGDDLTVAEANWAGPTNAVHWGRILKKSSIQEVRTIWKAPYAITNSLGEVAIDSIQNGQSFSVKIGTQNLIHLYGWATGSNGNNFVQAYIDDKLVLSKEDISRYYRNDILQGNAGYTANLSLNNLTNGIHKLCVTSFENGTNKILGNLCKNISISQYVDAPSNIKATASDKTINVTWDKREAATSYRVIIYDYEYYKKNNQLGEIKYEKTVTSTNANLILDDGNYMVFVHSYVNGIGSPDGGEYDLISVPQKISQVTYQTQVQQKGWLSEVSNGVTSGTTGSGLRMETLKVSLKNQEYSGNVEYRSHIQRQGWETTWKKNGELSGTIGKGLRLEAIQIKLTGEIANHYDIYYRVHSQRFGWLDWAKNGESAGTSSFGFRVEAVEIKLVKKGNNAPGSTKRPYITDSNISVTYQTQVQQKGWLSSVSNGITSGTTGSGLRMEALKLNINSPSISGGITYRSHIQRQGWENSWKNNGSISGTTGQGLRLEAIQIKLTGEIANIYDIYYRVHSQRFGWLDWAKNGESAGTSGYGYRVEAIQIVLIKKSDSFPYKTSNSFKSI